MKGIYIFKDGKVIPAKLEKLFGSQGPYVLDGQRLDFLNKVKVISDSSTRVLQQTGTNINKSKTGSVVGRSLVGGAIAGEAGAVVGGLSGQKETVVSATSREIINTELTVELFFDNGKSKYILLKNNDALYWLLSFIELEPLTEEELAIEEEKAAEQKKEEEEKKAARVQIKLELKRAEELRKVKASRNKKILWSAIILISLMYPSTIIYLLPIGFLVTLYIEYIDTLIVASISILFAFYIPYLVLTNSSDSSIESKINQTTQTKHSEAAKGKKEKVAITKQGLDKIASNVNPDFINRKVIDGKENKRALNEKRSNEILVLLKTIPVSEYKKNLDLYTELLELNPDIEKYKIKRDFYSNKIANLQNGFSTFYSEAEKAKVKLGCPNSVIYDTTPPSFDGDGALYGCIRGKAQTVKWFINEVPGSNHVKDIKFLWNDWFMDRGYGLHTDKREAVKALKVLVKLYAPYKEKEIMKTFFSDVNKTISSDKFTLKYTYHHGPAINERMIVVTQK